MSVVSRRAIPNERLKPTTQKLYAANGTEIALLGELELTLMLADYEVTAAVVISEEVNGHRLAWPQPLPVVVHSESHKNRRKDCDTDQSTSSEHAEKDLRRRRHGRFSRSRNQRTCDHGLVVAPLDVGRLGRGTTVSRNRDIGRKDSDEGRMTSFCRPRDERREERFIPSSRGVHRRSRAGYNGGKRGSGLETA